MKLWQNINTTKFTFTRSFNDLVSVCKLIKELRNNVVLAEIDISRLNFFINERKPSHTCYMKALDELHKDGAVNIHRLGGKKIILYVYPKFIPFLDLLTSEDPWEITSRKLGNIIYSAFDFSDIQRD